ncbi:hypothetical protein BDQ12DRAFT_710684 [Crucibulum laeve]|uniref:NAD(P)-binding domain-containing protein n=1 Tax=Crucibulum laeve TaxID=68775 RepID=A0A5C3MCR9_9AGAR|nr:hypothetical protein BDQ12DRAFT_710684 [Crucibulum laeve]
MSTLVTGGTGKTGIKLAHLLHDANCPFIIASRAGKAPEPFKEVRLDWLDATTFENPFVTDPKIDRVYLICPPVYDMLQTMKPFVDLAVDKGIKRFVLLSASGVGKGDIMMGKVHEYLVDIGVEYFVLRPTWFMKNFAITFGQSIQNDDQIFSIAGDGRIPFIAAQDIAQAAFNALVANKSPDDDSYIVGPELYTYDEALTLKCNFLSAAELLTDILGRKITHKKKAREEMLHFWDSVGAPKAFAERLTYVEEQAGEGSEEVVFNADKNKKIVGKIHLLFIGIVVGK